MPRPPARDQLLEAAARLFYADGIAATGVDAVARAAGVTKPTLYAHFGSKTDLVTAALEARHASRAAELTAWIGREDDPRERVLAVFAYLGDFYAREGERGCAFLNAAAELAGGEPATLAVVAAEKDWLLERLAGLARDAALRGPERLASQLLLLVDGIAGRVVVGGRAAAPGAVADAGLAARALVAAA